MMFSYKGLKYIYRVVEVLKEETATEWGRSIVRTIWYDDEIEAQKKMATIQPKEGGKLMVEKELNRGW